MIPIKQILSSLLLVSVVVGLGYGETHMQNLFSGERESFVSSHPVKTKTGDRTADSHHVRSQHDAREQIQRQQKDEHDTSNSTSKQTLHVKSEVHASGSAQSSSEVSVKQKMMSKQFGESNFSNKMTYSVSCQENEQKRKTDTKRTENGVYTYDIKCSSASS